ncbi:MAG TPA: hypothetical protein VL461_02745 [Dictyobacter sp.]|nr:hypothetical protein [Dictyobacter sp.]
MTKKLDVILTSVVTVQTQLIRRKLYHPGLLLSCALIFLLSIVFVAEPMLHMAPAPIVLPALLAHYYPLLGHWLPEASSASVLPASPTAVVPGSGTAEVEFLLLMGVACAAYGLMLYHLSRHEALNVYGERWLSRLIWLGALLAGLLFVAMPAMLSRDLFVYADYGHILVADGANPYFVAPIAVSHDVITRLDGWNYTVSAYGPVWIAICSAIAWGAGSNPLAYFFAYRLLGLLCHLCNIWLVSRTLRSAGCTPRVVRMGTFLYAWNPLILLESCMGAHNDICMTSLLLLGFFLAFRAEQQGQLLRARGYLPVMVVLTLATLIKFTTIPVCAFFVLLLALKMLQPLRVVAGLKQRWASVLRVIVLAGGVFLLVTLFCYLPLWVGHTPQEIISSFANPPTSQYAENSLLRVLIEWMKVYGMPAPHTVGNLLLSIFAVRHTWNDIDVIALGIAFLAGIYCLWRTPTLQMLVLVSIVLLSVLLLTTPWFYTWYVIWPVALTALAFTGSLTRLRKMLVSYTLSFSFSSFFIYIDTQYLPAAPGYQLAVRFSLVMFLPLLVALVFYCWPRRSSSPQESDIPVSDQDMVVAIRQDFAGSRKAACRHDG